MNTVFRWLLAVLLFLGTGPAAVAEDKTVTIATGFSLGPYVLRNGGGILSDIIKESLLLNGYDVRFDYMSNADALDAYRSGKYDAVTVVRPGMVDGHLSEPVISFNNRFITLASSPIQIVTLDDLKGVRLLAFSKASSFMGDHYIRAIKHTQEYEELAYQEDQVDALFTGKTDAILADDVIFRFFHRRLLYKNIDDQRYHQDVRHHYEFAPTFYNIAFQDDTVKQAFDEGFVRLRESGRVDAIYRYYLELLKEY